MTPTTKAGGRRLSGRRPFIVQVRPDGSFGLSEAGSASDVPDELRLIAASAGDARVDQCRFYWSAASGRALVRVWIDQEREGASRLVLLRGKPVDVLPNGLTRRELEVLTLLSAGLGNAELARQLSISPRTATTHVDRILRKLERPTRTAAAAYAIDQGLLHAPLPGSPEVYAGLSIGRLLTGRSSESATPTKTGGAQFPVPRRELVIGAVVPLEGVGSADGREMLNGLTLAIAEINEAGGVRGRRVRTEVRGVNLTSAESVHGAFSSLLSSGVDVLTSGYLDAQELGHEAAACSGVPYLHAATSGVMERAVEEDPGRLGRVFQVCPSDTGYAPRFVSYLSDLRDRGLLRTSSSRLVVLQQGWAHLSFGAAEAERVAAHSGWELEIVRVGTSPGVWARAVTEALQAPTAAVMIGSYLVEDAVQAVEAARQRASDALVYAIYAPSVPAFRGQLGAVAEGVVWSTTTGTYSDARGVAFARRYANRFGDVPGRSQAGLAYDRANRIVLAWRLAEDLADPASMVAELKAQPYRGVNGTYNFDTPGQVALGLDSDEGDPSLAQPQLIYQIQNGRHVIIQGGPFRTGEFRPQ